MPFSGQAQCTSPISTFPYNETFEANNGNWFSGGNFSDWAWGSPTKPVINSSGSGTRCWVTGGLTGSSYSNNAFSWLQSPCFDLSTLANPQISFRVFWETELQFDGANLQYSLDDGTSWTILGAQNSNSTCAGVNWYNFSPVQFLGNTAGWSGNIQTGGGSCRNGQGSGQWLVARHTLSMIAGQSRVIFRFYFGAGSICNAYDGFGIDDVIISEAPASNADFSYQCRENRLVSFLNNSTACPTSFAWNFDDPLSGASNTSTAENPNHTFSSPGNYQVSLAVSFPTGPPVLVRKPVTIFDAQANITGQIRCNNDQTGAIQLVTDPPAGSYTFSWNTNPVQTTASIANLAAGTYTATITANNTCSINLPVTISSPDPLNIVVETSDEKCSSRNGQINTTVSGGVIPYNYAWSNLAGTSSIGQLTAGTYSMVLTDANGCTAQTGNINIININNTVTVNLGADKFICPGQSIVLNPGNFASYLWQDQSTNPTFTARQSGTYSVQVVDADGCTGNGSVKVTVDCRDIYFPSAFTPGNDGLNDRFGPVGDLSSISKYVLNIYGRWGQLIFTSVNPLDKWDGTYKGLPIDLQTVVWVASFSVRNRPVQQRRGTVTVIR